MAGDDACHEGDPQGPGPDDRSEQDTRPPPGVDALQAAAREAIDATRALLDVAEAMVNDPEMVERFGSVVRAARAAGSPTASGAPRGDRPDDGDDGVQRIPVA